MMQLGLFQDWYDAEEVPRRQESRPYVEDSVGLALARIWTPSPPADDPAFLAYGRGPIVEIARQDAEWIRADERVSPATILMLRG